MRFLILIALFVINPVKSQIIEPCIGLNYSWISQLDQIGHDYKPGYRPAAGIGTNIDITYRWSFVPKLLYSARGNKEKVGNATLIRVINYNSYISMPLELHYIIKNNFKIGFGFSTAFWLKSSSYTKSETGRWRKSVYSFNNSVNTNFQRDNRFDLAARVSLRFDSPFKNGDLKWEVSYNHGFVPLVQPNVPPINYEYLRNRWVQLLLVYPLKFQK